jgi:hypothetical protein
MTFTIFPSKTLTPAEQSSLLTRLRHQGLALRHDARLVEQHRDDGPSSEDRLRRLLKRLGESTRSLARYLWELEEEGALSTLLGMFLGDVDGVGMYDVSAIALACEALEENPSRKGFYVHGDPDRVLIAQRAGLHAETIVDWAERALNEIEGDRS